MKKEQAEILGFVPQKEIVYNKLLPYADKLDRESNDILAQIKGNLGRAVQFRELWPGVLFWTRKLSTWVYSRLKKCFDVATEFGLLINSRDSWVTQVACSR